MDSGGGMVLLVLLGVDVHVCYFVPWYVDDVDICDGDGMKMNMFSVSLPRQG